MAEQPSQALAAEMAHVLLIDLVGYSLLPMKQQRQLLNKLQDTVRGAKEFCRACDQDKLISLPTGDGMALVFFGDPEAPARCALELSRALWQSPEMQMRMGLHTGPVYRMADINLNRNVAGGGINIAQRVMDCGDQGHILLSSVMADVLIQFGTWSDCLHDLGEADVKHGVRVHLYSLYSKEFGNPSVPYSLRKASTSPQSVSPDAAAAMGVSSMGRLRGAAADPRVEPEIREIALLYKRDAEPDNQVLGLLERHLRQRGCNVFVDRHLTVGMEWAREIEHRITCADAVVVLLSESSIHSEMLGYEIQVAHDAALQRNGRPWILPVRLNYGGPLPSAMGSILDGIQYSMWKGPQDNDALASGIVAALQNPGRHECKSIRLEAVGGAVPLDSQFYIVRPTDGDLLAAIDRNDSIILIKGARQMGKTSLMARGLQEARKAGTKVVLTDFQKLNGSHLESVEKLFLTLSESFADQLDLNTAPEDVWNPRRGPSMNFECFLRREVLDKLSCRLVWGMDEADRLFSFNFASEVFGLFRSWHNERALSPEGPWQKLSLAISYASEAHMFITDMNQSPFNVGTRLVLNDFTLEQVNALNKRYGVPLKDSELTRFYELLGGQPYLTRRGLHELAFRKIKFNEFEAQAPKNEGPFGDHLRRILVSLAQDPGLSGVVRGLLSGKHSSTTESFYRLRSSGIVAGDSARDMKPRCLLYQIYLTRHLQ